MSRANDAVHPTTMQAGITLREHFAGLAMQAIIGTAAAPCLISFGGCEPNIAATAVGMADALIEQLAKPIETPLDERGNPVRP